MATDSLQKSESKDKNNLVCDLMDKDVSPEMSQHNVKEIE